ncbi:SusC/RagA family TonB-linked outer membrane protein [Chryseobacterium sp. A301]
MKKQILSVLSLSMLLSATGLMAQQAEKDTVREETIEEVVLVNVGYGVQKKSVVTGAISKVTSEDFENAPNGGIGQMMQGRSAGVTIAMNSGAPGSSSTIRVRGVTTFSGANDPLWVVDGVPLENADIATLNQGDIESIEILKDAASAAIYGVRAAKGVILVTTKSARKGRMTVAYNGYTSYSAPSRILQLLNGTEYGALMNERSINGGEGLLFNDLSTLGVGTDWQKEVFNTSAFGQNHELSFSGRNDTSQFYASFGIQEQEGIVATPISNYRKQTARVNSTHKFLNNILTFGQNLFYTHQKNVGIGDQNREFGGVLADALMLDPLTPTIEYDPVRANSAPYTASPWIVRDANGNPYGISNMQQSEIVNPLAYIQTRMGNYSWSDVIVGNAYLQAELIPDLKLRSTLGAKKAFWGDYSFNPQYYLSSLNLNVVRNNLNRGNGNGLDWNLENTLTYDKKISDHDFAFLLGQGVYVTGIGNFSGATHYNVPTNDWREASFNMAVAPTDQLGYSYNFNEVRRTSLFARLNYNYQEKYLLTAIVRRDGSSLFGPNNKYGTFPSVSAGWVVTKENFWPENSFVNELKIRAGYGKNGNDGSLAPNQYESLIANGYNYYFGTGPSVIIGSAPETLSNNDLHWETTTQKNIGIDTRLFNNFTLTAEYYQKVTEGILLQYQIPGYVGVTNNPWGNIGDMKNDGFELELSYRKKFGDLKFDASANFATLKNEVTKLNGLDFIGMASFQSLNGEVARLMEGLPYGSFYGWKTNGIFQNWDEVNSYTSADGSVIQPDAKPGDFKWMDTNGDGTIDSEDRTFLGSSLPKNTFGLSLNFEYKGFDLNAMFQGVSGNKIFQGLRRLDVSRANYQAEALQRWTGEGTSNNYPRLTSDDTNGNFTNMSDFYLQDGDYVRLKVLSLGYSLPAKLTNAISAQKIRVYVTGNNVWTLTDYNGYDPEIGGDVMGVDKGYYPQPKTLIFGINLQF